MTHDNIDILVVDDDLATALFCRLYCAAGAITSRCEQRATGAGAGAGTGFRSCACDVRMAEMDGIATLKEIKALIRRFRY